MYKNATTNEEIKTALGKCNPPQLRELVLDADLGVMNFIIDVLADFIEDSPIVLDRKKSMIQGRFN